MVVNLGAKSNPHCISQILLSNRPKCTHNPRHAKARVSAASASTPASAPATTGATVSMNAVATDSGPPRLSSALPSADALLPLAGRNSLPLMVYLPGIDGTGLAAARQFPSLLQRFDLVTLVTPPTDRSNFSTLVDIVVGFLRDEVPRHSPTRPVYLLGESFGGVLALAVAAAAPELVDRLVLVNPATSFETSLWPVLGPLLPQIPSQIYQALPIALAPVLGNPLNLLSAALEGSAADASIQERLTAVVQGAAQLLSQLPLLAELLPAATLEHKLKLLQEGCVAVAPLLGNVPQRVLLIVGDQDLLLPSSEEGPRLQRALQRAHLRVEKGRSHALLQEGGVDLVSIMQEEGALVMKRRMSAKIKKRGKGPSFGSAAPIELPTEVEMKRYTDKTTAFGRRLSSPMFFSTAENGAIALGLGNTPTSGNGPVLYVGNHQTLALDLGVLCEEFLSKREIMLRGLAHPVIFADGLKQSKATAAAAASTAGVGAGEKEGEGALKIEERSASSGLSPFDVIPAIGQFLAGGNPFGGSSSNGDASPQKNGSSSAPTDGRQAFADFLVEFGAVPVSGRNMVRLLQNGESVLLFPGGVREAYRRKNEEYKLFWPKRAEFVRMAAKYGATIVPFAAVGVDDSLEIILDADELQKTPILGQMVASRAAGLPQARRGVAAGGLADEPESFVSPLALPKLPPRRMYFLFQKPISTTPEDLQDRARCEELYVQVKSEVEGGLEYLLRRRKEDEYEDFGKRVFYEAVRGGKQAPTFPL